MCAAVNIEGAFAALRRRGAEEAGAIFIKVNRLDGTGTLYGPAPQTAFDEAQPSDRGISRLCWAATGRCRTPISRRG